MPRKPREFVSGGIYHVFNRGNNQRVIFEEDKDYEYFKRLLEKGSDREEIQIYHYCLMSTHYHLLIRSGDKESLPRFMHWVQLGYVRYFKKRRKTTGHIFEERYRSPRIATESYYLQCGRYIERNPIKSNVAINPEDYPYSSAPHYICGKEDSLITTNLYYLGLGCTPEERQVNYQKFVRMDEPYRKFIENELLKY